MTWPGYILGPPEMYRILNPICSGVIFDRLAGLEKNSQASVIEMGKN
jgi:hypothetical protein